MRSFQLSIGCEVYSWQRRGGVSRVFSEILPRICDLDPAVRITLWWDDGLQQPLPRHPQIASRRRPCFERWLGPRPPSLISRAARFADRVWMGPTRGKIWHSTFYSIAPRWDGPVVVTIYDMIPALFPKLFASEADQALRRHEQQCVEAADRVICISESTARDLQRLWKVDPAKIRIAPLGCSPVFRPPDAPVRSNSAAESAFFLYVGSRAAYKNFDGLLRAYRSWPERERVRLLVVGEPWSPEESRLLSDLGLTVRVSLLSPVEDERLRELYSCAAALVYPSLYEGFGLPLLEAMACGCPVVASRIPSTLEVAGDCPIYFDPTVPESFCQALTTAWEAGRDSLGSHRGLERARQFSWDRTAAKTLAVYHELLESRISS